VEQAHADLQTRHHPYVLGSVQDFATVMTQQSHAEVSRGIKAKSFVSYTDMLEPAILMT
jgi:hypothetical protein